MLAPAVGPGNNLPCPNPFPRLYFDYRASRKRLLLFAY